MSPSNFRVPELRRPARSPPNLLGRFATDPQNEMEKCLPTGIGSQHRPVTAGRSAPSWRIFHLGKRVELRNIVVAGALLLSLDLCLSTAGQAEKHGPHMAGGLSSEAGEVPEPISLSPVDGVLAVAYGQAVKGRGRRPDYVTNVYNGMYIPPVLRLKRGDELQLKLVNETGRGGLEIEKPQMTNLHLSRHGHSAGAGGRRRLHARSAA